MSSDALNLDQVLATEYWLDWRTLTLSGIGALFLFLSCGLCIYIAYLGRKYYKLVGATYLDVKRSKKRKKPADGTFSDPHFQIEILITLECCLIVLILSSPTFIVADL